MPIYDRPTKSLMAEWADKNIKPGQIFSKPDAVRWFSQNFPKIKSNTVAMHVEGMSVNNRIRRYHPSIKSKSGHDLFYKLAPNKFRLWDPDIDGPPLYKADIEKQTSSGEMQNDTEVDEPNNEFGAEAASEFAFEKDLQNYLIKNLGSIEPGLHLYEEEGITGVEYNVGGRYIDILAVDKAGSYVVIELKVSRGYDRVVGQLLRYMTWVEQNMEAAKPIRGMIVAKEITSDLKLAASRIPGVQLIEYELAFKLRPI
jgi:hypothetical protein